MTTYMSSFVCLLLSFRLYSCARWGAGAAAVLQYGETFDDVPLVVNVAGRFHTSETPRSRFTEEQWDQLETTGSFQWNVKVYMLFVA